MDSAVEDEAWWKRRDVEGRKVGQLGGTGEEEREEGKGRRGRVEQIEGERKGKRKLTSLVRRDLQTRIQIVS